MRAEDIVFVPLTQGQFAIIDADDADRILAFRWHFSAGYAMRRRRIHEPPGPQLIGMHNVILGTPAGLLPDHINRNRLDNRKSNLRPATPSQTQANRKWPANNTSGFRGVFWNKRRGTWHAAIKIGGKNRHLGVFRSSEAAARAYDVAALAHFGAYAWLNFPEH